MRLCICPCTFQMRLLWRLKQLARLKQTISPVCRTCDVFCDAVHDMARCQLRRMVAPGRADNFHQGMYGVLVEVIDAVSLVRNDNAALQGGIACGNPGWARVAVTIEGLSLIHI